MENSRVKLSKISKSLGYFLLKFVLLKQHKKVKQKNKLTIKQSTIFLNKKILLQRAELSNKQIENGQTYTQKEIEQESKKW